MNEELVHFYRTHRKSIVATVALIGSVVHAAITDGVITGDEWTQIGVALATAVFVYWLPNEEHGKHKGTYVSGWADPRQP